MPSKCAVLVNSCDKYEDAWHPFFRLFDIMWPECPYDVYLNTETKECGEILHGGAVKTLHPSKTKCSWSKRLKDVLKQIDSEYVITLLDDFFLMSPVRGDVIHRCLELMASDDNLAGVNLSYPSKLIREYVEGFSEIDPNSAVCINCMSWLWRKSFLLTMLKNENAWEFELFASMRYRYHKNKATNKLISITYENPVFHYYIYPPIGYGIYQGKWLNKNKDLFEQHGIEADFSQRATISVDAPYKKSEDKHLSTYIKEIHKHPSQIKHYLHCLKNIIRHKYKSFLAKYLNM